MSAPTLWVYETENGWGGHIDWHDGKRISGQSGFDSERQAAVVISRMNGMEPPEEYKEDYDGLG